MDSPNSTDLAKIEAQICASAASPIEEAQMAAPMTKKQIRSAATRAKEKAKDSTTELLANPHAKRLFIGFAIQPTESLRAALKKLKIGAQKKEMEFDWVPEANFHITVCFLGATSPERVPLLEELIEKNIRTVSATKTSLKGLGGFPDERHLRTLWVGMRKSRALAELQDRLRSDLILADFPQEEREYLPHLTIGKLRKTRSATDLMSPFVRTSFGDAELSSLILYESAQRFAGSRASYRPLRTFTLS